MTRRLFQLYLESKEEKNDKKYKKNRKRKKAKNIEKSSSIDGLTLKKF